mmetsp:Transcript_20385/g.46252  ORF Transcript_20385/g.46252 Transcript_20385/m.46252 type:complete len:213 (-) Transcript_20385:1074-1712(-)
MLATGVIIFSNYRNFTVIVACYQIGREIGALKFVLAFLNGLTLRRSILCQIFVGGRHDIQDHIGTYVHEQGSYVAALRARELFLRDIDSPTDHRRIGIVRSIRVCRTDDVQAIHRCGIYANFHGFVAIYAIGAKFDSFHRHGENLAGNIGCGVRLFAAFRADAVGVAAGGRHAQRNAAADPERAGDGTADRVVVGNALVNQIKIGSGAWMFF